MARKKAKKTPTPKNRFKVGETYQCRVSGKVFRIERCDSPHGERFLLRSLESGNPGTPKNVFYLNLQIEDGELTKVKKPIDYSKIRHAGAEDVVVFTDPRKLEQVSQ